jgi:hypothetical protein
MTQLLNLANGMFASHGMGLPFDLCNFPALVIKNDNEIGVIKPDMDGKLAAVFLKSSYRTLQLLQLLQM